MTPKSILDIVRRYYGFRTMKQLTESAKPDLWRYPVLQEARELAGFLLRRHCDLSEEELQATLKKQLQWSGVSISLAAEQAKRKLASGDFAFKLAVQGIEQLLMLELVGNQRRSNTPTKRNRKGRSGFDRT